LQSLLLIFVPWQNTCSAFFQDLPAKYVFEKYFYCTGFKITINILASHTCTAYLWASISVPKMSIQKLLASYLFQNRSCPLAGMGNLSIVQSPAISDFGNKKIIAPTATIQFSPAATNTDDLLAYLAHKTNTIQGHMGEAYEAFCKKLASELHSGSPVDMEGIGQFNIDAGGNITFQSVNVPAAFLPSVTAERVIHPEAEHSILVGDKETTNTVMTEYFNEEPVVKDRWWIWAIVLAALAIGTLIIYYYDAAASVSFGNAVGYDPA
jgi:hypothetical protein